MIAVVDYGVGNLFSLVSSLRFVGAEVQVSGNADEGLEPVLLEEAGKGKPFLGICLGMQLLFEKSTEYGEHEGLGLIPGKVVALRPPAGLKVPHMGWNSLRFTRPCPLFRHIGEGEYVYYVHSYHATGCADYTVAVSDYGIPVTGAVARGNVFGTQFHPEKSGETGLAILKAFDELVRGRV